MQAMKQSLQARSATHFQMYSSMRIWHPTQFSSTYISSTHTPTQLSKTFFCKSVPIMLCDYLRLSATAAMHEYNLPDF